jgi:hypothetical protein
MEPMPEPVFDIGLFFDTQFGKRPKSGRMSVYNVPYDDYRQRFVESDQEVLTDGSLWISSCGRRITRDEMNRFMLRGPWDRLDFSKNERELAWRIECLRTWYTKFTTGS